MKLKELTGDGPPPRDLDAKLGQKYREGRSRKAWIKTSRGWSLATFVHIEVLISEKNAWLTAAKRAGVPFEDWIIATLNAAAQEQIKLPKTGHEM